jgi:hypothetical protein
MDVDEVDVLSDIERAEAEIALNVRVHDAIEQHFTEPQAPPAGAGSVKIERGAAMHALRRSVPQQVRIDLFASVGTDSDE